MKCVVLLCASSLLLAGCGAIRAGTSGLVDGIHGLDPAVNDLGSPMSTVQTFWVLNAASVINTQKTIDDHLVSWISGYDCSTVRASTGDHYCVEKPETVPTVARASFCYKTLAAVNCYDRPVPYDQNRLYGIQVDRIPAFR